MITPPTGTIHQLRTCRQASPAVVARVPGYIVIGWTRTPRSPWSRLLTVPGTWPESWTPRQNGALLSGWLRARCALVSVGCGSSSGVFVIVADDPGGSVIGPESFGTTSIFAGGVGGCGVSVAAPLRGTPAVPCCACAVAEAAAMSAANAALRRISRMGPPWLTCAARSRSDPALAG